MTRNHRRRRTAVPFRAHKKPGIPVFAIAMVTLPLAAFIAVFMFSGPPQTRTVTLSQQAGAGDKETASFTRCGFGSRTSCVVDGDTIWYRGTKIRMADINTPEVSSPDCDYEARLGARATLRLTQLLNAGPFALEQQGRDADRYGRQLRTVTRGGASLGAVLVAEGLAEPWTGRRRNWCAGD